MKNESDPVKELAMRLVKEWPGRFELEPSRDPLQLDRVWDSATGHLVARSSSAGPWMFCMGWVKSIEGVNPEFKRFEQAAMAFLNLKSTESVAIPRAEPPAHPITRDGGER